MQVTQAGIDRLKAMVGDLTLQVIELQLLVEQQQAAPSDGAALIERAEQAVAKAQQLAQTAAQPTPLEGRRKAAEGG